MSYTKRSFLIGAGTAGLILPVSGLAAELPLTPDMALGPFYPVKKPKEADADLTRLRGHKARAKGEVVEVSGRVMTPDGRAQSHAKLEIWQANCFGHYSHPNDKSPAETDPNFQGYANITADAQGRFRFLTIKPPPYSAGEFMRAAHIHLDVTGRQQRLITQLYFPTDEKLLRQDKVLMTDMSWYDTPFPGYIFGKLMQEPSTLQPGAEHYEFNVVLLS